MAAQILFQVSQWCTFSPLDLSTREHQPFPAGPLKGCWWNWAWIWGSEGEGWLCCQPSPLESQQQFWKWEANWRCRPLIVYDTNPINFLSVFNKVMVQICRRSFWNYLHRRITLTKSNKHKGFAMSRSVPVAWFLSGVSLRNGWRGKDSIKHLATKMKVA